MNRSFWLLRLVDVAATLCARMLVGLITWYLIKEASDTAAAGFVFVAYYGVKLISGALLAPMSDRLPPLRLFVACSAATVAASALCLGLAVALPTPPTVLLLLLVCTLGVPDALLSPAITSIITRLVPENKIATAFRHKFTIDALGNVLAIALGVVSLDMLGLVPALLATLLLAVVPLMALAFVKIGASPRETAVSAYQDDLVAGYRAVLRFRFEVWWNALSCLANFAVVPLVALVTPHVVKTYWGGAGWRVAALELAITLGVIAAAQLVQPRLVRFDIPKHLLVKGAFASSAATVLLLLASQEFLWWLALYFLLGVAIIVNNLSIESMRALAIPASLRGRLQTIHYLLIQAAIPVGFAFAGAFLDAGRLRILMVLLASMLALSTVLLWFVPKLRELLAMSDVELPNAYERLF